MTHFFHWRKATACFLSAAVAVTSFPVSASALSSAFQQAAQARPAPAPAPQASLQNAAIDNLKRILAAKILRRNDLDYLGALGETLVRERLAPQSLRMTAEVEPGRWALTPAGRKIIEKLISSGKKGRLESFPSTLARPPEIKNPVLSLKRAPIKALPQHLSGTFDRSKRAGAKNGPDRVRTPAGRHGNRSAAEGIAASSRPRPPHPYGPNWRPPKTLKGRIARILGSVLAGAGIGAVSSLLWGPAAMAYFVTGSILKSVSYNSDALRAAGGKIKAALGIKPRSPNDPDKNGKKPLFSDDAVNLARFMSGLGFFMFGVLFGNPIFSYLGFTFTTLGFGEILGKEIYQTTYEALKTPGATRLGQKISKFFGSSKKSDGKMDSNFKEKQGAAHEGKKVVDPKPPVSKGRIMGAIHRSAAFIHKNKAEIARIGIATAVSVATMGGIAFGTNYALDNTVGNMSLKPGTQLSWSDRARNSIIGGYRYFNLSAAAFKNGENTQRFYKEMKAKYNPQNPQEWAEVIEREITWTSHTDLYGANMYYITSEEAARVTTYGGVTGRFSDCTGKAALLTNMLKNDGYGASEVVLSVAPISMPRGTPGHAWVIGRDASGNPVELFHYSNTTNLNNNAVFFPTDGVGLKGNKLAEFAGGGTGGLATQGIYRALEKIEGWFGRRQKNRT